MNEESSGIWVLVGILAVAMQILAGHIQYVFYTGLAASLYFVLLLTRSERKLWFCLSFAGVYLGALMLTAVQFLPAIQAAGECVRGPGVSLKFASTLSFPLENLVTWLVPEFFGNETHYPYWGRWNYWEMSLFFSVTGFALSIYAIVLVRGRIKIELSIMTIVLLLLAFGSYMPWFHLFYDYVPGFDKFRSTSKFICQATVFMIMLSAMGVNDIFANGFKRPRRFTLMALLMAIVSISVAACLQTWPTMQEIWRQIMHAMDMTQGSVLSSIGFFYIPKNVKEAGEFAARSLYIFAGTCLLVALTIEVVKHKSKLTFILIILATAELLFFGRSSIDTFRLSEVVPKSVSAFLTSSEEDCRVLLPWYNATMLYGGMGIWGYDPYVLRRYAEFVAFTQGLEPDQVTQYMPFRRYHPLFSLMRCKYALLVDGDEVNVRQLTQNCMRRVSLIHNWTIVSSRDAAFLKMGDSDFNPQEMVVLENDPHIIKQDITPGESDAGILDSSTDYLIIDAQTNSPAILLITDAYSKGWHARSLEGSSQDRYEVIPADYAFQGIPLKPGKHRIKVEYMPWEFRSGRIISLLSFATFAIWAGIALFMHCIAKDSRIRR
jgi:hypothetical protein